MRAPCPSDFSNIPSPAYVLDKSALIHNAQVIDSIHQRSGAEILMALKAFASYATFPFLKSYFAGTTASSIHEARLGYEEFKKEVHVYAPAYSCADVRQLSQWAHCVVFNSFGQKKAHIEDFRRYGEGYGRVIDFGLRVNPQYSEIEVDLYDPCRIGSRLGVPICEVAEENWDGLDGLHFHTMCEQDADVLERTLEVFEEHLGNRLSELKWVNFGGGHHITRKGYDIERLVKIVTSFRHKYGIDVYLEPGEAVALNAGYLVSTVLDIINNDGLIAILDTSATAHMPDVLEMPYRPEIIGAELPGELEHTYKLGGMTCLAGDEIGSYSFEKPLKIGDKLIFCDMAIYSIVKNNMFNGVSLPSIVLWDSELGEFIHTKEFGFDEYKRRLS